MSELTHASSSLNLWARICVFCQQPKNKQIRGFQLSRGYEIGFYTWRAEPISLFLISPCSQKSNQYHFYRENEKAGVFFKTSELLGKGKRDAFKSSSKPRQQQGKTFFRKDCLGNVCIYTVLCTEIAHICLLGVMVRSKNRNTICKCIIKAIRVFPEEFT